MASSFTPAEVLGPLDMLEYSEALLVNLATPNGKALSAAKLGNVKCQHLSMMGITDFSTQRKIMARIKTLLAPAPEPKAEEEKGGDEDKEERLAAAAKSKGRRGSGARSERRSFERRASFDRKQQMDKINRMRAEKDGEAKSEKLDGMRRRSFDKDNAKKEKSEIMKDVEKNMLEDEHAEDRMNSRPQRKSLSGKTAIGMRFTESNDKTDERARNKDRAWAYGNSAQRAAKADDGLARIGAKVMREFKEECVCDRSSLMFFDSINSEMFFYSHEQRFKFDMSKGIAGYVAMTGEVVNVPDAYADSRFNQDMDKQTGFKTKSILCAPIKSRSQDGVVAVIQMLNKRSSDGEHAEFTEADENVIRNCAFKVSEALDLQYQTLVNAQIDMERISLDGARNAKPVLAKDMDTGGGHGDEAPLPEDSRLMTVASEKTDPFANERRQRQKEYGMEVREAKVGL
ncbi:hypothetical protein TeGR_g12913 [Tetraparma gracilis]|uniref:GAF domain-containing protein n=1 Tax=Tetraparma gracilis TaxID=2962635 RepID=A0ABQ6MXS4_9STRA|nr:hypothetical protein TeGR_g12913 [Tetraparma gracilis]